MRDCINCIHRFKNWFEQMTSYVILYHPFVAYLFMFIGIPFFIIVAISVCTAIITIPIAWLFGWL